MAKRRMFSLDIVDTDMFLDMPATTQNLYFHLAIRADDDGFISSPKKIMRNCSASQNDYDMLIVKKFIIQFDDGICVVKHWRVHNYIQKDRYTETIYKEHKEKLLKEDNVYMLDTECIQTGNTGKVRLGKVREGKVNNLATSKQKIASASEPSSQDEVNQVFDVFYNSINPAINYGNKTSRKAAEWMIGKWGIDSVIMAAQYACEVHGQQYAPTVTTPYQLKEKMSAIKAYKEKQDNQSNTITVI